MKTETLETQNAQAVVLTPEALLEHWQGHRRVSRRVLEAFPEDKLFTYSIGGMRTYATLAMEMIRLAVPGLQGSVNGKWASMDDLFGEKAPAPPTTKKDLLELWDKSTDMINQLWTQMRPQRFQEEEAAFGMFMGTITSSLFYLIDNEIHHRGQGYVYLRSLGIEPPPFWDRN